MCLRVLACVCVCVCVCGGGEGVERGRNGGEVEGGSTKTFSWNA